MLFETRRGCRSERTRWPFDANSAAQADRHAPETPRRLAHPLIFSHLPCASVRPRRPGFRRDVVQAVPVKKEQGSQSICRATLPKARKRAAAACLRTHERALVKGWSDCGRLMMLRHSVHNRSTGNTRSPASFPISGEVGVFHKKERWIPAVHCSKACAARAAGDRHPATAVARSHPTGRFDGERVRERRVSRSSAGDGRGDSWKPPAEPWRDIRSGAGPTTARRAASAHSRPLDDGAFIGHAIGISRRMNGARDWRAPRFTPVANPSLVERSRMCAQGNRALMRDASSRLDS